MARGGKNKGIGGEENSSEDKKRLGPQTHFPMLGGGGGLRGLNKATCGDLKPRNLL